jgi:hypothetical protein
MTIDPNNNNNIDNTFDPNAPKIDAFNKDKFAEFEQGWCKKNPPSIKGFLKISNPTQSKTLFTPKTYGHKYGTTEHSRKAIEWVKDAGLAGWQVDARGYLYVANAINMISPAKINSLFASAFSFLTFLTEGVVTGYAVFAQAFRAIGKSDFYSGKSLGEKELAITKKKIDIINNHIQELEKNEELQKKEKELNDKKNLIKNKEDLISGKDVKLFNDAEKKAEEEIKTLKEEEKKLSEEINTLKKEIADPQGKEDVEDLKLKLSVKKDNLVKLPEVNILEIDKKKKDLKNKEEKLENLKKESNDFAKNQDKEIHQLKDNLKNLNENDINFKAKEAGINTTIKELLKADKTKIYEKIKKTEESITTINKEIESLLKPDTTALQTEITELETKIRVMETPKDKINDLKKEHKALQKIVKNFEYKQSVTKAYKNKDNTVSGHIGNGFSYLLLSGVYLVSGLITPKLFGLTTLAEEGLGVVRTGEEKYVDGVKAYKLRKDVTNADLEATKVKAKINETEIINKLKYPETITIINNKNIVKVVKENNKDVQKKTTTEYTETWTIGDISTNGNKLMKIEIQPGNKGVFHFVHKDTGKKSIMNIKIINSGLDLIINKN